MKELVLRTPEHVEIRIHPAGPGSRLVALVLDSAVILSIAATATRLLAGGASPGVAAAVFVTTDLVASFGWNVYFELARGGRTPGKRAAGLRVICADGLPITPARSFLRNALRILDSVPMLYGLGGLVSLADPAGRRLGDLAAGTIVVREDLPRGPRRPLPPARRFNTLRTPEMLRRFRHRVGLPERELLDSLVARAGELEPAARYEVMERAGELFRAKLGIDEPELSGESLVHDLAALGRESPSV